MKKNFLIGLIIGTLAIITFFILLNLNYPKELEYSENYTKMLESIEECNLIDVNDRCFGYHYYWKGCYYDHNAKNCPNYAGTLITKFDFYNLNNQERIDLCFEFEKDGFVVDCLRRLSETKNCLEFASNDDYLIAICNLRKGEILNETI